MRIHLFISHSWRYGDEYDSLIRRLKGAYGFDFKDYSVPKNDPIIGAPSRHQLENAIAAQMRPCSVVLVMAGVYASYSEWIDVELALAKRMGKPIIAVAALGAERISASVRSAADVIVSNRTDAIVNAISQLVKR